MEVKRSYPSLKLISWVFKFFAIISVLFGVLIAFVEKNQYSAIASLIVGVIGGIFLLACSESLKIFLDIEENTRRTANLLDNMENPKQPNLPVDTTSNPET